MRQNGFAPTTANAIAQYFNKANQPSQQETLGQIVVEILREGKSSTEKRSAPDCYTGWNRHRIGKRRAAIKR